MNILTIKKPTYDMKPLFLGSAAFELVQVKYFPDFTLVQWLGLAIIADFLTAFYRAKVKGEARTSRRVRATFPKMLMYFGTLVAVIIVENAFNLTKGGELQTKLTDFFNNLLILLMIYAEVLSILENIIIVNGNDIFSTYVLIPIYRMLTWQFKGNILNKIGTKQPGEKLPFLNENEQTTQ